MFELKQQMAKQQESFKEQLDKLQRQQQDDAVKKEYAESEIRKLREQLQHQERVAQMKADRIYQMANESIKKARDGTLVEIPASYGGDGGGQQQLKRQSSVQPTPVG